MKWHSLYLLKVIIPIHTACNWSQRALSVPLPLQFTACNRGFLHQSSSPRPSGEITAKRILKLPGKTKTLFWWFTLGGFVFGIFNNVTSWKTRPPPPKFKNGLKPRAWFPWPPRNNVMRLFSVLLEDIRHAAHLPEAISDHLKLTCGAHLYRIPSLHLSHCRSVCQQDLGLSLIQPRGSRSTDREWVHHWLMGRH